MCTPLHNLWAFAQRRAQVWAKQGRLTMAQGLLFTILMHPAPDLDRRITLLARHLEQQPNLRGIEGALAAATTPIERAAILMLAGRRLSGERAGALAVDLAQVIVLCLAAAKRQHGQQIDHATRAWSSFTARARGRRAPVHDAPCPTSAIPVRRLAELSRPRRCP